MRLRVLILAALMPIVLWGALPLVSAGAPTRATATSIQKQLDATRKKIGRKKGTERLLTTDITRYSQKIGKLQTRIGGLQTRVDAIQTDLDARRADLVRVQDALRSERARLTRLRVRLGQSRRLLATRMVEIYKADAPGLVEVVMNAHGFEDLLERGEFLRRISENDRRIVDEVRAAKADATSVSTRLASLERRKQKVAAAILAQREQVDEAKQALVGTRHGLTTTRAGKQAALGRVQGDRQTLEHHEAVLQSEQRKVQAALAKAAGNPADLPAGSIRQGSGQMIWPVDGPITSPFCERRAWESCHPGIDIGVPSGTPIRAAMDGRVVLEQPESASGGYGNFTCIQHTQAMSTCYAHQERFVAGVGDSVKQGEVIGISDCTGRCFGPHLHFEVRINGAVTNPMNYL